jgi:hypothetical protein
VPLLLNGGSFSKASAPPLFLEDENFFQKSATLVAPGIAVEVQPTWPIFEKCSHLREKKFTIVNNKKQQSFRKRGGADFFSGFVWWVVWASPIQI